MEVANRGLVVVEHTARVREGAEALLNTVAERDVFVHHVAVDALVERAQQATLKGLVRRAKDDRAGACPQRSERLHLPDVDALGIDVDELPGPEVDIGPLIT